jgi:hypothetical protein
MLRDCCNPKVLLLKLESTPSNTHRSAGVEQSALRRNVLEIFATDLMDEFLRSLSSLFGTYTQEFKRMQDDCMSKPSQSRHTIMRLATK